MTISESNLGVINTESSAFKNNINQLKSAPVIEQAMREQTTLGATFSKLFTGAQQANQTINPQSSLISNDGDNLSLVQQSIFSSLGFGSLSSESGLGSMEQLTSQSSIETMQASFLSSLQNSIFSPPPAKIPTEINNVTNSEITTININNAAATEVSISDDISKFSFGDNGLEANDGFDILNVLNHIPVVSSIYQEASGQEAVSAVSKLAGGFLYGGVFGLTYSALDLAVDGFAGTSMNDAVAQYNYSGLFSSENIDPEQKSTQAKSAKQSNIEYFSAAEQLAKK